MMRCGKPLMVGVVLSLGISWLLWGDLLRMPIPAPVSSTAWERQFGRNITPATCRLLDRRLPSPRVYDAGLEQVMNDLRDSSGAQIFVDWQAIEAAGIGRDAPAVVDVSGLPFGTAILKTVAKAKAGKSKLACYIENDVIAITTELDVPRKPIFTFVYEVRDFMDVQPERKRSFFTEERDPSSDPPEELIERIKAISPDSWVGDGDGRGSVRPYNGRLIITQTQPYHRDIAYLLYQMRRQRQLWSFTKRSAILHGIVLTCILVLCLGFYRFRARARRRDGRCLTCGYDLRASTGCCPECGTAIPVDMKRPVPRAEGEIAPDAKTYPAQWRRKEHKMKQRLTAYLLLLPIGLLGLSVLLWARGYLPEHFYCRSLQGRLLLLFVSGNYAGYLEPTNPNYVGTEVVVGEIVANSNAANWKWAGFELVIPQRRVLPSGAMVGIPFVAIVLVLAPLSVWSWCAYRRYCRRLLPGHCRQCGYDLRASTERCPECGTAIGEVPRGCSESQTVKS